MLSTLRKVTGLHLPIARQLSHVVTTRAASDLTSDLTYTQSQIEISKIAQMKNSEEFTKLFNKRTKDNLSPKTTEPDVRLLHDGKALVAYRDKGKGKEKEVVSLLIPIASKLGLWNLENVYSTDSAKNALGTKRIPELEKGLSRKSGVEIKVSAGSSADMEIEEDGLVPGKVIDFALYATVSVENIPHGVKASNDLKHELRNTKYLMDIKYKHHTQNNSDRGR